MTGDPELLEHRPGCPQERTEAFKYQGHETTRCIDCGAQVVRAPDGSLRKD